MTEPALRRAADHGSTQRPLPVARIQRRIPIAATLLALLAVLAGCGESPPLPAEEIMAEVEEGYGKQAVLNRLPEGSGVDEAPRLEHGYRVDRYFLDGRTVEVLWVRERPEGMLAELERHEANPVIFIDQVLDGWGWEHFDERAEQWEIVDRTSPPPEEEVAPLLHEDERPPDSIG